jgi:hypothetical protein
MRAVLIAIASVGLVGCVGSLDSGNGGAGGGDGSNTVGPGTNPNPVGSASMAEQMFESDVYPIIKSGASSASDCSQCHDAKAPEGNTVGFVAEDVADAYATITSFQQVVGNFTPAEAGILTQVANSHSGRVYSADDITNITNWLAEEVTERSGAGMTTGPETDDQATARVLNQWSGCMTLTDFNTAKMATAWGNMTDNNNSKCSSCHVNGYMGFIATPIVTTVDGGSPGLFTELQTSVTYMTPYFTVDLSGGPSAAKVVINTTAFMGVSQAQPPHVDHDEFNATNNQGMTALQTFYTATMAHVTAAGSGACSPSLLAPPPT